jgi:SMODS-associating 2TM, beta-strand rich effector domain
MQIKFTYYKAQLLVPVIGLLWALSSWALSGVWGYGFLQGVGPTAIVMLFLTIYDKWLWNLPVFSLLNTIPDLNGIYHGEISYRFKDIPGSKSCQLEIKQTCSNIRVKTSFVKDGENNTLSVSTEAFIKTDEAGDQHLYFYYRNRGSCQSGDTLDQHDGMNVLEIVKDSGAIYLEGYYFTNRNPQTKGCLKAQKMEGKIEHS